ncbi:MAG TPA: hypothetical protein ENH11_09565 [Candidatus Acetothermia bacterium]|nr:hypothetical protein [Candidatus Acetothermia bacterium]
MLSVLLSAAIGLVAIFGVWSPAATVVCCWYLMFCSYVVVFRWCMWFGGISIRDAYGWPLERVKGRPVLNVLRVALHTSIYQTIKKMSLWPASTPCDEDCDCDCEKPTTADDEQTKFPLYCEGGWDARHLVPWCPECNSEEVYYERVGNMIACTDCGWETAASKNNLVSMGCHTAKPSHVQEKVVSDICEEGMTIEELAVKYQVLLRTEFPTVHVRKDPQVGDLDGGMLAVFCIPDDRARGWTEFMTSGKLAELANKAGLRHIPLLPHTESTTKTHYPELWAEFHPRSRLRCVSCGHEMDAFGAEVAGINRCSGCGTEAQPTLWVPGI